MNLIGGLPPDHYPPGAEGAFSARSRASGRQTLVLLLRLSVVVCLVSLAAFADPGPGELYRAGRKAEKSGRMTEAYLLYSRAAALDPQNRIYWLRSLAVRTRALTESKTVPNRLPAATEPAPAAETEAEKLPPLDPVTPEDLVEARKPLPPKHLNAQPGLRDFDLRGNARYLFEQVAKSFGLDCVFDSDYPPPGQPFPFRMEQTDYRDALHALEAATSSFIVPLSDRLFLVVKDTIQKRNEKEPAITLTVDIPSAVTVQEAQELAIAARQALEIRRFGVDSTRRIIVMRDWISKVWPARQLMQDLLAWRPSVAIDLEFLEVSHTDTLAYGVDFTTQFPVFSLARVLSSVPSIPSTVTRLALFGGGRTLFGIGLADATLIARMSNSDARTLMRTTIQSNDGPARHAPRRRQVPDHDDGLLWGYDQCVRGALGCDLRRTRPEAQNHPQDSWHRGGFPGSGIGIQSPRGRWT